MYKVHKLINDKCLIADDIFTRSPMEIMPTTFPCSMTGRWRTAFFGHDGHAGFHGLIRSRKNDVRFHNVADEVLGDPDVFGAGEAVQGVASEIIAILTENEEEEPPRAE